MTDTARTPIPFDIAAAPGAGTTVLEASAGTGKTYAIVAIAARYIAEGTHIDRLLLVTFSRAASAELRERMRERVRVLVRVLASPEVARATGDDLERLLATGTPEEIDRRRANLTRALSDFDSSTIATTHTFCNRMLEALGFLGEREMVTSIVEDVDDIAEQVARDRYLAGYAHRDDPDFGFAEALSLAREAVRDPAAVLSPTSAELAGAPDDVARPARRRVAFTTRIRELVESRKRLSRLRTYDDLQSILYRIIVDRDFGTQACERIRASFDVALVDEFQDTDPQQWEIVRRCFHGHTPLVLVGDPKQAIYGFRGAEVLSYLSAVTTADEMQFLATNHRSDAAVVDSLDALYRGATLGNPEIVVHPVSAAHAGSRLAGSPPVRLRGFLSADFTTHGVRGYPPVDDIRQKVTADVAADITTTLNSGVTLTTRTASGEDGVTRPVRPGDIAILVRKLRAIEPLQQALAARGIASVVRSGTSVFHTDAARHWLWVLRAVEQPARTDRVRLAALTPLIGWDEQTLGDADDTALAELAAQFVEWGRVLVDTGFAAMSQRLMDRYGASASILSLDNGERTLTDLLQIATLCNKHVVDTGCGPAELVEWLSERIDEDGRNRAEDQSRRLDRDAQAVQIMTIHASKGLQFPIVYLPFGWDSIWVDDKGTISYHDAAGTRFLDVGGRDAPGRAARRAIGDAESAGEELRLLYVALTRAQSQLVLWWAPAHDANRAPLHRLLFGRADAIAAAGEGPWTIPDRVAVPGDDAVRQTLVAVGADCRIAIEAAGKHGAQRWSPSPDEHASQTLSVASFDRTIDQTWRRTSYSAITAGASHGGPVPVITSGSEPDTGGWEPDETDVVTATEIAVADAVPGTPSLMNGLPFGAAFGTVVHEALEYVDTSAADMQAHVRELCAEAAGSSEIDVDVLTAALCGVLTTPLGFGTLWDITPANRLAELDFEFPLPGAASAGADANAGGTHVADTEVGLMLADVADLLATHLDADDPLARYADELRALPAERYRGFLTGSIDSVLRTDDGRYVVVDYKTNRLRDGFLTAEDFTVDAMAAEMMAAHYPLQALLYSVALHRYLRWRLPGYDPSVHLGPVQYHFVRAMVGPATPPGCGVFEWRIPSALVTDLSDLIAGTPTAGRPVGRAGGGRGGAR